MSAKEVYCNRKFIIDVQKYTYRFNSYAMF